MIRELENIPAVWTVLFHWLSCLLYVGLLPRKRSVWQCVLLGVGLLMVQIPLVTVIAPLDSIAFALGMSCFAILTMLPFLFLCRGSFWTRVYYGHRAFLLGGLAVSLAWQMYTYCNQRMVWLRNMYAQIFFMLLLGGAVYICMFLLERGHWREMQEMPVSGRSCLVVSLIAQVTYLLNGASYVTTSAPFTVIVEADAFSLRTIIYLGGVAILYAYHLQLCDAFALQEVNALQNIVEMLYANYQQNQEAVDIVNQKYHDLKHQIAVLRSEANRGDIIACLDQMDRDIRAYEVQNKTGNDVLDTILTGKSIYCHNHDIRFTCVADGHALDFMGVMDLSALFGNALDNAIESVIRVEDPEQRLIHLSVNQQKGFLRIRVENCCPDDLTVDNDLPQTSKGDANYHGYVLKSIRSITEKYGGSMTLKANSGRFVLGILIPIPTTH